MKTKSMLCSLAALLPILLTHCALGQGTAFNYQGRLNDGPIAATGPYDLRFAIYDLASGGSMVAGALTRSAIPISNGSFSVTLDFGTGVFTGAGRWLEIGVRTNGAASFTMLSPRQALTPAPYAITAGTVTGIVPSGSLAGPYAGALTFNNVANQFSGDGSGLRFGGFGYTNLPSYWKLTGNAGTTPGVNFVGTTDNQPMELRVNRQRALRLEPTGDSPNVIGGYQGNSVDAVAFGGTIGGGGGAGRANRVVSTTDFPAGVLNPCQFTTISGGAANEVIGPSFSTIGGGLGNQMTANETHEMQYDTISGGVSNRIRMANASVVGGGAFNFILGDIIGNEIFGTTIGGGEYNLIETWDERVHGMTIGGGSSNHIAKGNFATIGGGRSNFLGPYSDDATIGGGSANRMSAEADGSTISGGAMNTIGAVSRGVTISGGMSNIIGSHADGATIGGGASNVVYEDTFYSTIGGGNGNQIQTPDERRVGYSTISGGSGNIVWSAGHGTISGGLSNYISLGSDGALIGGGEKNFMDVFCTHAVIAGGLSNSLYWFNRGSTISGGVQNRAGSDATYSTLGGGAGNTCGGRGSYGATIGGGLGNTVSAATYAGTIAGGSSNYVNGNTANGTIGGGADNLVEFFTKHATIAGGYGNIVSSGDDFPSTSAVGGTIGGGVGNRVGQNAGAAVISGGESNQANGSYSTVAGGLLNFATNNAFAAGSRAKAVHPGAFVWAAGNTNDFPSFSENRVHFYASGGLEMEYGGQLTNGRGNKWIVLGSQAANRVISVYNGAYLSEGGAWTDTSDRNAKENFEPVNPREILDGVVAMPVTRWNYRAESNSVRHLGPVAQDFHRAFGLGADNKHIAGLDGVGVALAAIQGLHQKLEAKEAEIEQLKRRLEALENGTASRSQR